MSSVTRALISGKKVAPETFEDATVYFSDIVGFSVISANSKPLYIVNLLNLIYTAFYTCITNFDVHKMNVETIGDAYMVSSGLRIPNGEIATMTLELLSVSRSFVIQHMPNVPILLRIGIHSGTWVINSTKIASSS
ncbi:unnamed protein product [Schistocephalus solidus]|uniref:Guanylate cyclase domain-containing protein n=1 Tax=Schistocephalus solidus TaxID=70667 RepID=A0A3P7D377_SCHSO|nr:unnamed protein product [Schistocephalus solidus]